MRFSVNNRYSDTDTPDKHGRWARVVYANNFQIAWISKVEIENKTMYKVNDYFPSIHNDNPCYGGVSDKNIEEVIQEVKTRFAYFINNSLLRNSCGYSIA